MKTYITTTEEPLLINSFIEKVIRSCPSEIVGINITEGTFIEGKGFGRKLEYIATIALISGPLQLFKRIFVMSGFFAFNSIRSLKNRNPFSIATIAKEYGIPIKYVNDINSKEFIEYLEEIQPDIIINQANMILKRDLISIPSIGCLNRHSALLPKYRGQLAPFWAYLNQENETGVSIHFLDDKIDNGPIVVQKRVPIRRFDTFDSLLEKIFEVTPDAMLEALSLIRKGDYKENLIENNPDLSSYYSAPRFKDALKYRKVMIKKWLFNS